MQWSTVSFKKKYMAGWLPEQEHYTLQHFAAGPICSSLIAWCSIRRNKVTGPVNRELLIKGTGVYTGEGGSAVVENSQIRCGKTREKSVYCNNWTMMSFRFSVKSERTPAVIYWIRVDTTQGSGFSIESELLSLSSPQMYLTLSVYLKT